MASIEERLRRVFIEQLGCREDEVTLGASIVDDLGADSLDEVELLMAVEEEFEFEISDEQAEQVRTFGDALSLADRCVNADEESDMTTIIERRVVSECKSSAWCEGWNAAVDAIAATPAPSERATGAKAQQPSAQGGEPCTVNGYLPKRRAVEILLDADVPEWITGGHRVRAVLSPAAPAPQSAGGGE